MIPIEDVIAPVVENRPLAGGHFILAVRAPSQAQETRPGQFAMLRMLGRSDVLLRRPMSIYDVTGENGSGGAKPEVLQFLYKVVGRGTRRMSELKPGDRVGLLGPLGHGFFAGEYRTELRQADEVLHVAGGIGIAALLLAARELARAGARQRLFFGGRTKHDLPGTSAFKPWVLRMHLTTEDGSRGERGYVTAPLARYLQRHEGRRFLLLACGPWAMLDAMAALARRYRQPCLVSMENRMGCALGVCLGCCIRVDGSGHGAYERVCTEGPVFWAERVVWDERYTPQT